MSNYLIKHGDALGAHTGIIVHGTNCLGIMGSGIALAVRNKYPQAYHIYRQKFETNGLKLGDISFVEVAPLKFIVNANTQESVGTHQRQVSYDAVVECFEKINRLAGWIEDTYVVKLDVIFPMIGAGLGGGDWNIIERIILETVSDDFTKILYKL